MGDFRPSRYSDDFEITKNGKVLIKFQKDYPPLEMLTKDFDNWVDNILMIQLSKFNITHNGSQYLLGLAAIIPPTWGGDVKMTPASALLKSASYTMELKINILRKVKGQDEPTGKNFSVKIPCMVGSKNCHLYGKTSLELEKMGEDARGIVGYFIINGNMKVMFLNEKIINNRYITKIGKKGEIVCNIKFDSVTSGTIMTSLVYDPNKKSEKKKPKKKGDKESDKESYKRSGKIIELSFGSIKTGEIKTSFRLNVFTCLMQYIELNKNNIGDYREWTMEKVLETIYLFSEEKNRNTVKNLLTSSVYDHYNIGNGFEVLAKFAKAAEKENKTKTALPGTRPGDEPGAPDGGEIQKIDNENDELKQAVKTYINSSLLANIDGDSNEAHKNKIMTLCMMISIMAETLAGVRPITNINSWSNKSITSSSGNCESLMRTCLNKAIKVIKSDLDKKDKGSKNKENILSLIANSIQIEQIFQASFNDKWRGFRDDTKKLEILQHSTYLETLAMLFRISPNEGVKLTKDMEVRSVQGDQWGFIDPSDTTENKMAGLVKEMTITCKISSSGASLSDLKEKIKMWIGEFKGEHACLLNGEFKGFCNGFKVRNKVVNFRRKSKADYDMHVSAVLDGMYLIISNDSGRPVRPLFIINEGLEAIVTKKKLWNSDVGTLFEKGALEFLDPGEQSQLGIRVASFEKDVDDQKEKINKLRASLGNEGSIEDKENIKKILDFEMENKFTHMEIHPQALFSHVLSMMPLLDQNQSPRISFQSQQGKQALGTYNTSHSDRFETTSKLLVRAAQPLVTSQMSTTYGEKEYPQGVNLNIALMSFNGCSQDDAFQIKKEVVDYGYLDSFVYTTIEHTLSSNEKLKIPDRLNDAEKNKYRFIDANTGLPFIGSPLNKGDIIVSKVMINDGFETIKSQSLKLNESGVVVKIYISDVKIKDAIKKRVQIKLAIFRRHSVGDKESMRYAQKGTTSFLIPSAHLPYDEETGESPDIIGNPHSIPRRMTIGYLLEPLYGLVSAITGKRYNGTPFRNQTAAETEEAARILTKAGFKDKGMRWMIDPRTGIRQQNRIFSGPCHFQVLHHFGTEKFQSRSTGDRDPLTRQPIKGAPFGGGPRMGKMEMDSVISHGAPNLLRSRIVDMSDPMKAILCSNCGHISDMNPIDRSSYCHLCDKPTEKVKAIIPYAFKLLSTIMAGAGILLKIRLEKNKDDDTENLIGAELSTEEYSEEKEDEKIEKDIDEDGNYSDESFGEDNDDGDEGIDDDGNFGDSDF